MKNFANLITSLILATWVTIIALFSIQNYELIRLNFLMFESVDIPLGVILALCGAVGMILGAVIPILLGVSRRRQGNINGARYE